VKECGVEKQGVVRRAMRNPTRVVGSVCFPEADKYYERSSVDGYAFLGCARHYLGLDPSRCEGEIEQRVLGLNREYVIRRVTVPSSTTYVYSAYPCVEFYSLLNRHDRVSEILEKIESIGRYSNGMVRYCEVETHYIVPNVTALAADMYTRVGRLGSARQLVEVLRRRQTEGNWRYQDARSGEWLGREDSFHLAMMVHSLRQVQRRAQIPTGDLVNSALLTLRQMNRIKAKDRVGWNPPYLFLAVHGIDRALSRKAYWLTRLLAIRNSNFRVRAIAAWALAKFFADETWSKS
jgi:hypothetical protein